MSKILKTTLAAALISAGALASTTALAWGGHGDGSWRDGKAGWSQQTAEQMKARMAERHELRMAELELALALTPEQKPAFDKFKSDMKASAERMRTRMIERRGAGASENTIERMQRMEEMSQQRQAEMVTMRQTVEAFYSNLSDAQKTVFDAQFQRRGKRGDFRHREHRGEGRQGGGMRN